MTSGLKRPSVDVVFFDSLLGGSDSARGIADRLGVDEIFTYSTLSDSVGIAVRLGSKVAKKERLAPRHVCERTFGIHLLGDDA